MSGGSDRAEFVMELLDKMSGPLKSIDAALGSTASALKNVKAAAGGIDGALSKVTGAAGGMGGAMKGAGGGADALGGSLATVGGGAGAAMGPIGALASAIAALAVIEATAAVGMAAFALSAADANRSLKLQFGAILGSKAAAEGLMKTIEGVAANTDVAIGRIEEMAKNLTAAGLRGTQLEGTLKALANVESVVGSEAAGKLQNAIEKMGAVGHFDLKAKALAGTGVSLPDVLGVLAKKMGKSVKEVEALMKAGKISTEAGVDAMNAAINAKLGNAGKAKSLGFFAQILKFKESLVALFKDVNIEPFLAGLHSVLELFSQSTASGRAMKQLMTTIFSGLFAAAAKVFPYVKAFIQGMVIGFLQVYIALKPIGAAISKALGGKPNESTLQTFVKFGTIIAKVIAAVILFGATIIGTIVGAITIVVGAIASVTAAFDSIGDSVSSVPGIVSDAFTSAVSTVADFLQAGQNMVQGIADGISNGASNVISAVLGVAKGAVNAAKSALGIASPSKVFAKIGGHTAEGFAGGVDDGADKAAQAMGSMVDPPKVNKGGAGAGAGGGGPVTLNLTLNITGGDPKSIQASVMEALTEALERFGMQMGAA